MISRRQLVGALTNKVAEWTVIERQQELATISEGPRPVHRTDLLTRFTIVVHHDTPQGRGSAHLDINGSDGAANDIVEQALSLANAAIGPIWRSTPPAAPAKVKLIDPALEKGSLGEAATNTLRALRRPAGATVIASLELMRERVTVEGYSGFRTSWGATMVRATALVSVGERSLELAREARQISDLELEATFATAVTDLGQLATATAPRPGRCALILRADAFLHGGGLGVWSVFADQASAETEHQGLTRYRLNRAIAPGADQVAEPLRVESDGALDLAPRSAPVGDDGDAVRRFPLVERGISVGLGMTMREAARRRTDPNGGVRNLVVGVGTWADAMPAGRTIDVRRLRSLSIDPYTGDASLDLALATDRDGSGERTISGGTIRVDLIGALARARRSASLIRRGPYVGPAAILIEDVDLMA